jgi:hypothetical protein
MQTSASPISKSVTPSAAARHFHDEDESCPVCEQPIPHDRADEIKERIEARERERSAEITARLEEQFSQEKAEELALVRQEAADALQRERAEAIARLNTAREEERQAADARAAEKLAEAARSSDEAQAALKTQIVDAQTAKLAAEQAGLTLREQLEEMRSQNEAAIAKMKADAEASVAEIRASANQTAEAAVQEKIAELMRSREESEVALQTRIDHAEAAKVAAEQQVQTLGAAHEAQLAARLHEQREALELAMTNAVNAEKSAVFEEKLKLSNKVEELQRALDRKTAEELGEGAEIDLFEALKAEFEGDKIERVNKGQPGADVLHTVIHNGKPCGMIVYDSKNHKAWRSEFVTKLASDKMAAKAEHAILSTHKFPAGDRQLTQQDGIIIASPARVVAVAQIIRSHMIQSHTLRLSAEERGQKTAALYSFMTSEQCAALFARIDAHAEDLLEMQVKEKKSHDLVWKRQGELYRQIQKARAELGNEIDVIIGTAEGRTRAT